MTATLTTARKVAEAILYEGYLLYPYRASSAKNQVRWQFGVLCPQGTPSTLGEGPVMQVECPCAAEPDAVFAVHLRFLQVVDRRVEQLTGTDFVEVPELRVADARWIPWQEAFAHELSVPGLTTSRLAAGATVPVDVPAGQDHEPLHEDGVPVGRLVRRRRALRGRLDLVLRQGEDGQVLQVRISNTAEWEGAATRAEVCETSFVSTHLLLQADRARLLSATARSGGNYVNERCWPVLIEADDGTDAVLAAPMILPDHPQVAPESPGDLFDATEIDEILTLRILTMTDDEKAQARGTDPRAAAIVGRSDALPDSTLAGLHGTAREHPAAVVPWWDPVADAAVSPEHDCVRVGDVDVRRGSRVRVHPRRRADAQDMFFAGRTATVHAVHLDVDGSVHVAVSPEVGTDEDTAWPADYGRHWFFAPDELEPLP